MTSAAERTIYVVPEPSNELVDVMVKRIALRKLGSGASVTYVPLPAGEYVLKAADGAVLARARVTGPGARVDLRFK